jgi:hypothetical protein
MTRILADIPDVEMNLLDARAAERGKSRFEMLGEILGWYCRRPEEVECAS